MVQSEKTCLFQAVATASSPTSSPAKGTGIASLAADFLAKRGWSSGFIRLYDMQSSVVVFSGKSGLAETVGRSAA
jgi:hypothetical protein